jgi:calcineurin-like phosphoesterase family protein
MKFYTSDLHLGHSKIIEYENRPFNSVEEMNAELIRRWNNKVKKGDEVYVIGDFSFMKGEPTNEVLKQLNGQKFLVKGNHDAFISDKRFDPSGFVWIKDYARVKDNNGPWTNGIELVLFHYPIAVWESQHHGCAHLYGHVHGTKHNQHEQAPDVTKLPNAFNVGVDVNDYEPKTIEELIKKRLTGWTNNLG